MTDPHDYYTIQKKYQYFKGDRYFKVDRQSPYCVQVCLSAGDMKKGRGSTYGIYIVSRITFIGNFLSCRYVVECKKEVYDQAFAEALKNLQ